MFGDTKRIALALERIADSLDRMDKNYYESRIMQQNAIEGSRDIVKQGHDLVAGLLKQFINPKAAEKKIGEDHGK